MRKRTQAREIALQILYQLDLLEGDVPVEEQARFMAEHADGPDVREYARTLIQGTLARRAEIDRAIEEVAKNWELGRMAIIDRNVLRMAIYEILYRDDIPPKVAINEAVDLAKKYSTKNSSAFVNGILDKVKERRPARGEAAADADVEAGGDGERDAADAAADAGAGADAEEAEAEEEDEGEGKGS